MTAALRVGFALFCLGSAISASAIAADEPKRFVLPPVTQEIVVNGELDEWDRSISLEIGETNLVRPDPSYAGPADLSGRIYVARSATTLYVAGEIIDDTLFWNPKETWRGDDVEVFLDFHPHPEARLQNSTLEPGYDTYSHQLLLTPLANEVRWRFAIFKGRVGHADDEVDGLRLAGLPLRDAKGATVGYKFELALPLSNFPAAPTAEGASFGFDIALSDSDGLPEQKNYATWSGHKDLARFPGRFGRAVLGKPPPTIVAPEGPGVSTIGPVAVLVALLGVLLFIWLGQVSSPRGAWLSRRLDSLRAISLRRKLAAAAVLVALIAGAGYVGDGTARALGAADVARKRRIGELVRSIAAEATALHLMDPQPPLHPSPLVSLLGGRTVKPPLDYVYTVIPPVAEETSRTKSGVPFLRRDIPATSAWSGTFVVQPPLVASAATVVYSWRPDTAGEKGPAAGERVAEIRLVHEDGSVDPPQVLSWGRHVNATDAAHPAESEAQVAFVTASATDSAQVTSHADQTTWPVPPSNSPIHRVEVEQSATGGTLILHGLTLTRASSGEAVPLPLGRPTLRGVPTGASPFPGPDQGLQLSKARPAAFVECDVPADRIWLVASLKRGYADARYRVPVLRIDAVFDDGSVDGTFRLENGISIDAESTPVRQHGDAYTSEVAFEWVAGPGQPRHFDAVPLELERSGRHLVELRFEFCSNDDEIVRISSITTGRLDEARRPVSLRSLESGDDGYRLAAQDRAQLESEGLTFTMFRDGACVATTASGDLRERMLARTLSPAEAGAARDEEDGVHEVRLVAGRKLSALPLALPAGRVLEMTWSSEIEERTAELVSIARMLLAVVLTPLLVLLAADLVVRVRSLHVRLVAAVAAVAAVPVVLGWFALPLLLGSTIEGRENEAASSRSAAVKGRLSALRSIARQRAEAALRDETLQEALRRRGSTDFRSAVAAALRDIEHGLGGNARVALEVFPLSSAGDPIVVPQQVQWTVFADRTATLTDELAYRQSRLTATGVAQQYDTAGDWRTTLVVELPLERATLVDAAAAAGGGVHALLYTPRGYPMATTLEVTGEDLPEEMQHKRQLVQRVLTEQHEIVETGILAGTPHTVAYDVLRGEAGVVGLIATAVPRGGTEALLRRIGLVAILVFGAGIAMQFLLAGLVVDSTTKPFLRTLSLARDAAGPASISAPRDEIATLNESIAAVRTDRDAYGEELSRLAAALPELAAADGPDAVVERALEIVRAAIEPWGALVLAADPDGRIEVLGGFRGRDAVPRGTVVVTDAHPLAAVVAGRGEAHLTSHDAAPEISVRGDRPLVGGAARLDAWPTGAPDRPGGALVLLAAPETPLRPRRVHDGFVAAFARSVGMALVAARLVRLSVHDADTNAYVPSFFTERLEEEVDRAVTGRQHIALLLVRATALPLDAGAARRSMQQLAECVRGALPARTFLGRLETDTLAAAVPETDRPAANELALELRRAIADRGLVELRVRVGAAACPEDAGSFEFLNAEASRELASEEAARAAPTPGAHDDRSRLVAEAREAGVVFESDTGLKILETVERIAASELSILIEGETGSGKEVVADLIHEKSGRRARPMVKVNCAALPDALLESELFGYERGAFTGADRTKPGRFELADGGTIFLDEIGDMPLATQVKLLRVLEDRAVEHLGGTAPTPIDVRVIAATNRDLRAAMAAGRFREDLYYRLSGVTISVPPLRARKEDIPRLAERFALHAAESHGRRPPTFASDAMDLLFRHPWPGNVRELRNVVEQAVVLASGDVLRAGDLGPALAASSAPRARAPADAPRREPSRGVEPPRPSPGGISDRQRRLLAMLSEREWVTNSDYCDLVGVSQRTGLRDLQELLERGVIVMEGKRRGARYRLR